MQFGCCYLVSKQWKSQVLSSIYQDPAALQVLLISNESPTNTTRNHRPHMVILRLCCSVATDVKTSWWHEIVAWKQRIINGAPTRNSCSQRRVPAGLVWHVLMGPFWMLLNVFVVVWDWLPKAQTNRTGNSQSLFSQTQKSLEPLKVIHEACWFQPKKTWVNKVIFPK